MRIIQAFLSITIGLFLNQSAFSANNSTQRFQLSNGLTVVVREDFRAPVVVTQVWYRVGSSYEPMGKTGLSHALEHMMFRGTTKVPNDEFSRIVAKFGGEDNAFTTDDYTAYYQVYSADHLALALELEADRMSNIVIKPEDFAQELRVVMEERRWRTDDNPQALANERFQALAMLTSPSRQPTIGWMSDLENMTVEDLTQWYKTWYIPNNATLVVVGAVRAQEVKALAEQYFSSIPMRPLPKVAKPVELPEPGLRQMSLELSANVPVLYMGFNVPSLNTLDNGSDVEALRLLLGVLDEGASARLEARLVREKGVATSIRSGYDPFARGDTLWVINALPAPGRSLEELEKAILEEVEKLKTEIISADEVKRVLVATQADDVFAKDSIQAQANSLGILESVGLPLSLEKDWITRLAKITPEQLRDTAKKYLVPARRTVLKLQPTGIKP